MKNARLLTALACAVLALLCWAGTGQAKYFGFRNDGNSNLDIADKIVACKYTLSEDCTAYSMGVSWVFDANELHGKLLIFEDTGSGPGDLVACTEVINGKDFAAVSQCWEAKFASPVSLTADDYYLAAWMDDGAGTETIRVISYGGTNDAYFDTLAYFDADTCVSAWGDGTNYTWDVAIWVNYRAEGDLSYTFYGGYGAYTKDTYFKNAPVGTQLNAGGLTPLLIGSVSGVSGGVFWNGLFAVSGIDEIIPSNATITSAICSLYVELVYNDLDTLGAYRVFKPWTEGYSLFTGRDDSDSGATWKYWQIENTYDWNDWGCLMASDDSTDNSWDGEGGDSKATPECWLIEADSASWYGWKEVVISNELAQAWLDGDADQNGFLLRVPYPYNISGNYVAISSNQRGLINDLMPRWYFEWTLPAGSRRRKVEMSSQ